MRANALLDHPQEVPVFLLIPRLQELLEMGRQTTHLHNFMHMVHFMNMKSPCEFAAYLHQAGISQGWAWEGPRQSREQGIPATIHGQRYRIVLNTVPVARGPELERALADAVLRARHAAEEAGRNETPLSIVAARSLSLKMIARLDRYAIAHLLDSPWGAFDLKGAWHFQGIAAPTRTPPPSPTAESLKPGIGQAPPPSHDPFSDLGQWLSKVMLAQDLDEKLVSAPRVQLRNQAALASAAGVSLATVSRWAKALRDMGFLVTANCGLKLVRKRDLLERWASTTHGRAYLDTWVRPILGSSDREALTARIFPSEPRAVLLGTEACHQLGMGVVHGAALQIALPAAAPQDLERIGLRPSPPGEPGALMVRVPRFPEALRRGAVRRGPLQVADAIQCAVDTFLDPARGQEQFEAILRSLDLEA